MAHPIIPYLTGLVPSFCSLTLGPGGTVWEPGPVGYRSGREDTLPVPPGVPADRVGRIYLDLPWAERFLSSLLFYWEKPQQVSLADLRQAFGPEVIDEELHEEPPTYRFKLRRNPLWGQLLVTVPAANARGTLQVTRMHLRRMAPNPYPFDQGRRIRLVVLADFGETAFTSPTTPLPSALWAKDGLSEVFAALSPRIHFTVKNHLDETGRPLPVTFAPVNIRDFIPDRALWQVPLLGPLVEVREGLAKLAGGKIDSGKLRTSVNLAAISQSWRVRIEQALLDSPQDFTALLKDLDRALSAQCELVFADERFNAFQAAWLGVQLVAEHLEAKDVCRVDLFALPRQLQEETFRERLFEEEFYHRQGAPPVLVVLGDLLSPDPGDFEHLRKLAAMAAQMETPLAFGIAPSPRALTPSAWDPLRNDPLGRYLIGCTPRLCLRPGLEIPEFAPKRFHYTPTAGRPADTTVWGSGAWALAALVASSQAKKRHIDPAGMALELPALLRGAPDKVPAILEAWPAAGPELPQPELAFTVLHHEPATATISLQNLRPLRDATDPRQRLAARFFFGPLVQTIRRIQYLYPGESDPQKITLLVRQALEARIPEAAIEVEFRRTAGEPGGRLFVRLMPAFEIDGQRHVFVYDSPW